MNAKKMIVAALSLMMACPVFAQELREITKTATTDKIWSEFKGESIERLNILFDDGIASDLPISEILKMDRIFVRKNIGVALVAAAFIAAGIALNKNNQTSWGYVPITIGATSIIGSRYSDKSYAKRRYEEFAKAVDGHFSNIRAKCQEDSVCITNGLEAMLIEMIDSHPETNELQGELDAVDKNEYSEIVTRKTIASLRDVIRDVLLVPYSLVSNAEFIKALHGQISTQRRVIRERTRELNYEDEQAYKVNEKRIKLQEKLREIQAEQKKLDGGN